MKNWTVGNILNRKRVHVVWVGVWVLVLSCVLRRLIVKESVLKKKSKRATIRWHWGSCGTAESFLFFFFALNKIAQWRMSRRWWWDFVMWINDAKSQFKNVVQNCKNDDGKKEEEGDLKIVCFSNCELTSMALRSHPTEWRRRSDSWMEWLR